MVPDSAIAAAERTEAARHLIDQAQTDFVDLTTVTGLELCVLGGPRHPLFEEAVARAWMEMANRQRKKLIEWVTEGMVERGLLIEDNSAAGSKRAGGTYSLKPELGIALAARCRPAFIVITDTTVDNLRTPRFFALGDQDEPVRAVVVEEPAALPPEIAGDFPHVKKFGPLGRFYRYVLVSREKAAAALAELTISPPSEPSGASEPSIWLVSLYRHYDGKNPFGYRLSIRSDGMKARVEGLGSGGSGPEAEYDADGLQTIMRDLITAGSR